MRTDLIGESLLTTERLLRATQRELRAPLYSGALGPLVTASGNDEQPFHGWFPVKEAFSHQLPGLYLNEAALSDGARIHDPFSGSGTTAVAATQWLASRGLSGEVSATEINPFLARLTAAKIAGITTPSELLGELTRAKTLWARNLLSESVLTPPSTTLANEAYIGRAHLDELLSMVAAVRGMTISSALQDILLCIVAASVEPAVRLRKDGRALRFVPKKQPVRPLATALRLLKRIEQELDRTTNVSGITTTVSRRSALSPIEGRPVSYSFFSPPYPNNIDYTEVYKLENWVLGEWSSVNDMLAQRRRTLRSHPTVTLSGSAPWAVGGSLDNLVNALVELLPRNRYFVQRERLIRGYAHDMYLVMREASAGGIEGGWLTFVVGNSLHGGVDEAVLIPSDLILSLAGEELGWRLHKFEVARYLTRRHLRSEFLRESVVTMRLGRY